MRNYVKNPRPEPPRVTSFGGFSINEAFAAVLALALGSPMQLQVGRLARANYPAQGRRPGDLAHKRWKRVRAAGRR